MLYADHAQRRLLENFHFVIWFHYVICFLTTTEIPISNYKSTDSHSESWTQLEPPTMSAPIKFGSPTLGAYLWSQSPESIHKISHVLKKDLTHSKATNLDFYTASKKNIIQQPQNDIQIQDCQGHLLALRVDLGDEIAQILNQAVQKLPVRKGQVQNRGVDLQQHNYGLWAVRGNEMGITTDTKKDEPASSTFLEEIQNVITKAGVVLDYFDPNQV